MASTVSVMAQPLAVKGIYTCTDASGNRLTADRPIAQCADREQRVLGPSGVERSRLGPALTEVEMAQRLEQGRQAQLRQQRVLEQRRRDAALLARYPQRSTHDAARRHALLQIDALQELARKQMQSLDQEGLQLQQELDFYAKDTSKIPARLSGSVHMLEKTKKDQQAVLAAQAQEAQRIHQRFDAELARLQPLWNSQSSERTPPVAN